VNTRVDQTPKKKFTGAAPVKNPIAPVKKSL